ncbi:hypothetical protein [Leptolyngbya sp. KIOST-1]|uniref:hypothetical protein n=1 Tax=Leptolyngbya sp. KIOST-1 TaxID=1229172 RepID=UPI0009077A20|nr:hypothetical protein [Leptolyngbya sp. KIOST-1]
MQAPPQQSLAQSVVLLKQSIQTFVLDADGELATALERYSADCFSHWSENNLQGVNRSGLAIDMFLTEGEVDHQPVLDIFTEAHPDLSPAERALVQSWKRTFNGLFVVLQTDENRYELMNWLTEKTYWVEANELQAKEELARLSAGEMLITRLAPGSPEAEIWLFSGPLMLLGKLGKPKLAVAIGNFKKWFPNYLYGDAPELLEEAWKSVECYYNDFVDFFGRDRITLPGHELNKKLQAYQDLVTERRLEAVGFDSSKSFQELADEAGISEEEMAESLEEMGEDGRQVNRLLKSKQTIKMAMPPINLPNELRRAEAVSVFVHPRWGQTFLTDYDRYIQLLQADDRESPASLDALTQKYLREETVNPYIWRCLVDEQGAPLLASLERCLDRPNLTPDDLDDILIHAGKSLTPTLPEIASVPMHLQTLFQEAMQEVNQNSAKKKSKGSKGKKRKSGFAL